MDSQGFLSSSLSSAVNFLRFFPETSVGWFRVLMVCYGLYRYGYGDRSIIYILHVKIATVRSTCKYLV
uniref:Uncharacterized protein n=1 Tax=Nelumbo nucifera TaxID=4432 RepID=A0A822XR54_NELNU|nr:TPA_asm: hypothetical protein HUJ06_023094 [Nelumbo nucifera]